MDTDGWYLGTIELMSFSWAPQNFAACDGSTVPLQQNQALYSLIGPYFTGSNYPSAFALPDLRGRMPLGQGAGPGLSSRAIAQTQGAEQVTLTAANLPPHEHQVALGGSASASGSTMAAAGSGGGVSPMLSGIAGEGRPMSVMPPSLTLNYVIAIAGWFPPRQ